MKTLEELKAALRPTIEANPKCEVTHYITALESRVKELEADLAECYRQAGAEPTDHGVETANRWDSKHAVEAVKELRKDLEEDNARLAEENRKLRELCVRTLPIVCATASTVCHDIKNFLDPEVKP